MIKHLEQVIQIKFEIWLKMIKYSAVVLLIAFVALFYSSEALECYKCSDCAYPFATKETCKLAPEDLDWCVAVHYQSEFNTIHNFGQLQDSSCALRYPFTDKFRSEDLLLDRSL